MDDVIKRKPFITKNSPVDKLYLILMVHTPDNGEEWRDWCYFVGTTQEVYEYLRDEIVTWHEDSETDDIDVMKSMILVDSSSIKISHICTIGMFMYDMLQTGKVEETTSFDINDYTYELDKNDLTPADAIREYISIVNMRNGGGDNGEE